MTKGEKESTVLTMESAALGDSSQAKPLRALRCSNCQLKHIRCDGAQPVCSTCLQKDRICQYPQSSPAAAKPNVHQLATKKRAFSACLVCRAAKRRCSGEVPVCGPCQKRGLEAKCEYDSAPPLQRKRLEPHRSSLPESPSDERPSKQPRTSLPRVLKDTNGNLDISVPSSQNSQAHRRRASPSFQLVGAISETPPESDKSHEGDDEGSVIQDDEKLDSPSDVQLSAHRDQNFPFRIRTLSNYERRRQSHHIRPHTPEDPDIALEAQQSSDSDVSEEEVNDKEESPEPSEGDNETNDANFFLSRVRQAVFQRTGVSKPGSTVQSDRELKRLDKMANRKGKSSILSADSRDLRLPHRTVSNKLVSTYLMREFVNLPLFQRDTFTNRYEKLWGNVKLWDSGTEVLDEDCLFIGFLFGVFALATLLLNPGDLKDAEQYFARAQNLVFLNGIEKGGILHIQVYLVLAQYLVADNNLPVAWRFVGLAIRAGQSLHLHLVSGSHHLTLRDNQELARRVWHCSLMLERIIAMKMGITTLTKHSFETPLPIPGDRDYIDRLSFNDSADRNATVDRPSIIEFFNNSTRLYNRYNDIILIQEELRSTSNSGARKKIDAFDPQLLITVDQSLANWQAGLPPFLHPDTNVNSLNYLLAKRQHNILRIRYLHMRLLLWRPLLAIVAATSPDIDARSQMQKPTSQPSRRGLAIDKIEIPLTHIIAHESAVKCILAAAEIINIIDEVESRGTDVINGYDTLSIPAVWETTGYVFACAQVFIAARRCPKGVIDDLGGMQVISEGAWRSIELMRKYTIIWPRAKVCLMTLEKLDSLFPPGRDEYTDGPRDNAMNDLSWLECLPIDLQG
ncbi:fungal specific transcription factor domain-containing protein [Histoplasma capsulatum G186AR]|uniref:Fungal specific transcription factor domain-containing protein n=1 Tax=Ajellomyces capsulatus TaxID=5037 RepID=A0A8H7YVJ1_AJECA|nr:fungal specific transcription factor domain-containing protein [Histoplasma capsulatum]QSS68044.1 fungal specific transcription factor domain-containing protein [Histoplasma capsulatum G186AR]